MRFANFSYFLVFSVLLAFMYIYANVIKKKFFESCINFSRVDLLKCTNANSKKKFLIALKFLRYISLVLIVIAIARPQAGRIFEQKNDQGIDIIIALDTSASMQSLDFSPLNRMDAAKKVTEDFISERKYDRIGIVLFASCAFTQCPLTTDKNSLVEFVRRTNIGDAGPDGTAIGSAIVTSINRLKDSQSKSKIIIVITDGNNNDGEIDPITASRIAQDYSIKIYTIGVGSLDGSIYEVNHPFFGKRKIRFNKNAINETVLKKIAHNTGGEYFRAQNTKSFKNIMKQIDKLEKYDIKTEIFTNYNELYKYFLIPAFILLLLVLVLENTYLRKLP